MLQSPILTVYEAAEILQVTPRRIYQLIHAKRLTPLQTRPVILARKDVLNLKEDPKHIKGRQTYLKAAYTILTSGALREVFKSRAGI